MREDEDTFDRRRTRRTRKSKEDGQVKAFTYYVLSIVSRCMYAFVNEVQKSLMLIVIFLLLLSLYDSMIYLIHNKYV